LAWLRCLADGAAEGTFIKLRHLKSFLAFADGQNFTCAPNFCMFLSRLSTPASSSWGWKSRSGEKNPLPGMLPSLFQ
jgi:hypothetical protein